MTEVDGCVMGTERVLHAFTRLSNDCLTRQLAQWKAKLPAAAAATAAAPVIAQAAPAPAVVAAFFARLNKAINQRTDEHFQLAWHPGSGAQPLLDVAKWTRSFEIQCPGFASQLRAIMMCPFDLKRKPDDAVLVRKTTAVLLVAMEAHRVSNMKKLVAMGRVLAGALLSAGQRRGDATLPVSFNNLRGWMKESQPAVVAMQNAAARAEQQLSAFFDNFQRFVKLTFQVGGKSSRGIALTVRALLRHRHPMFGGGTVFRDQAGAKFTSVGPPGLVDGDAFRLEYKLRPSGPPAAARSDGVMRLEVTLPWPSHGALRLCPSFQLRGCTPRSEQKLENLESRSEISTWISTWRFSSRVPGKFEITESRLTPSFQV